MNTAIKHIRKCANETGVDWPPAISSNRITRYKGRKIESYYYEDGCYWETFCLGIGCRTSQYGRDESIEAMKAAIDKL